ncbi:hypothetical protein [Krasilnikovia sp. MM14-A1004]|uniref:hypothetical protein n=1 Tax=Krasilnikovia sp. MM14-A1004 TaxID=3373541 RepID=UPI00399CD1AE
MGFGRLGTFALTTGVALAGGMALTTPASAAAGAEVALPAFLVGNLDKPEAVAAKALHADCSGVEAPGAGYRTWRFDTAANGKFKVFTAVFVGAKKKKLAVGRWAALDPQNPSKYIALDDLGDLAERPEFKDIAQQLANDDTRLAALAEHLGFDGLPELGLHGAMSVDFGPDREMAALTLPTGWKLRAASTVIESEAATPEDVADEETTTLDVTGVCPPQKRHGHAKHHRGKHHHRKHHRHAKNRHHHGKHHHGKHHHHGAKHNHHGAKHNHHIKHHHAKNHHAKNHHGNHHHAG